MAGSDRKSAVAQEIAALAALHGVHYAETPLDRLGDDFTRLSGDDVKLDVTERLLIALQREGHLTKEEVMRRLADYHGVG